MSRLESPTHRPAREFFDPDWMESSCLYRLVLIHLSVHMKITKFVIYFKVLFQPSIGGLLTSDTSEQLLTTNPISNFLFEKEEDWRFTPLFRDGFGLDDRTVHGLVDMMPAGLVRSRDQDPRALSDGGGGRVRRLLRCVLHLFVLFCFVLFSHTHTHNGCMSQPGHSWVGKNPKMPLNNGHIHILALLKN